MSEKLCRVRFTLEIFVPESRVYLARNDILEDIQGMSVTELYNCIEIIAAPDATLDDVNDYYRDMEDDDVEE